MSLDEISPAVLWGALVGLLGLVCTIGFVAGLICAPWLQEWTLKQAAQRIKRLQEFILADFSRLERMCRWLSHANPGAIAAPEWERLEIARNRFHEAWRAAVDRHLPVEDPPSAAPPRTTAAKPFRVTWALRSVDAATQLPDHATFQQNLELLLEQTTLAGQTSGLLLVRMDKSEHFLRRFGGNAAEQLQQRVATVVQQAARPEDLVCRLSSDLFGVLMPSVTSLAGARLAETMRAAVRQHPFRLHEGGPEMLVTASFGFSLGLPNERSTLIVDRAGEALAKSQAAGRNQLHVHDACHRTLSRIG